MSMQKNGSALSHIQVSDNNNLSVPICNQPMLRNASGIIRYTRNALFAHKVEQYDVDAHLFFRIPCLLYIYFATPHLARKAAKRRKSLLIFWNNVPKFLKVTHF